MRRIITGHNENGKSIITLDGPPARSIGEDVGGLFELWNTDGNVVISTDLIDRAEQTGHSTTLQAAQIASQANVKMLLIGHFSQRYKDLNDLLIQTKKGFSNVTLSYAGLVIDFQDI